MDLKAHKDELTGRWFLEGVEPEEATYKTIVDNLKQGINFKFARYGDGEIYCMHGKSGTNCDGHVYFPDLGGKLLESIEKEPSYMVGIQPLSVSHLPELVTEYFGRFKKLYNSDVLHSASIDGRLGDFFDALKGRYIIVVGPVHLADLFECVHIVIPSKNCWLDYDKIVERLGFHLKQDAVVLLCASMMSEVIIKHFEKESATFIDVGSCLDPYAGVYSRRYHYKLKM